MTRVWRIVIQGAVQGRGVRPAIARLAATHGWGGDVRNTPQGVELTISASTWELADVVSILHSEECLCDAAIDGRGEEAALAAGFTIEPSLAGDHLETALPLDSATCAACLAEFDDPADRRHRYGMISCVACGPRYSVTTRMPFDRQHTSLLEFPICGTCGAEYDDLADRRGHAQTIGCPECGPDIWATSPAGQLMAQRDEALAAAANALLNGECVAMRGVGGYQLLVDATSHTAVARLRLAKQRPLKPLAVMCSTAQAERLGVFDVAGRDAFLSAANPIVLVPRRPTADLEPAITPGVSDIGLLAPTTGMHYRLLQMTGRPLVCTSGNVDGEPLAVTIAEAQRDLAGIADLLLHQNRPICQPVDDSVVRALGGRVVTIRCARGLAPLVLKLPCPAHVVALGGHHKSALALSNGAQSVLLPHVGDLSTPASRDRWGERLQAHQLLFQVREPTWVLDAHPDYFPSRTAGGWPGPKVTCWHHHAHSVAGMLEQQWLDRTVLGVSWDGAGWGIDRTTWGGEFLAATATGFERVAHLRPFALIGGDLAATQIARTAVSLLTQLDDVSPRTISEVLRTPLDDVFRWQSAARSRACVRTTSMGRFFDGVAALVLGLQAVGYEGEAALRLEGVCDRREGGVYSGRLTTTMPAEWDWRPLLTEILVDLRQGCSAAAISGRFLRSLARGIVAVSRNYPELPVVLGGGVFQNRALVEMLIEEWPANGPPLGVPGRIPPNDGGLAAGQLAIAAAQRQRGR